MGDIGNLATLRNTSVYATDRRVGTMGGLLPRGQDSAHPSLAPIYSVL